VIIIPAVVGGILFAIALFLVLLWYLRRKRAAGLPLQFQYERQSSLLSQGVAGRRPSDSGSQDSLGWKEGGGGSVSFAFSSFSSRAFTADL